MLLKIIVGLLLLAVIFHLGSGLFYLLKDKRGSTRTVRALSFRISLSVGLFSLILIAYSLGWVSPHGL